MNDFEYIKQAVDIRDAARLYGLKLNHSDMCCCFEHGEKTPSMKLYGKDRGGNNYHCFGCGESGSVIDLTMKLHNIGQREALQKLNQDFGLGLNIGSTNRNYEHIAPKISPPKSNPDVSEPEADYTELYKQASQNISSTSYHRGISEETLKRFNVGFVQNWRHPKAPPNVPTSPRLIIPTSKSSYLARDTRSNLTDVQKKYAKSKVGKIHLFNETALQKSDKPIFVVEGEIDALSIIDSGGQAVALGSVSNIRIMLDKLEKQRPTQPIVIARDNDSAGMSGEKELVEGLKRLQIPFYSLNIAAPYKDANEAFMADKETFSAKVKSAENLEWLKNAKTVLTAYSGILKKWEQAYKYVQNLSPANAMYAESMNNQQKIKKMLSFFGGDEYKLLQIKPEIEKTAMRLREIMQKGLNRIQPVQQMQINQNQNTVKQKHNYSGR